MVRRVTIADIARHTGVSQATVSLVLNGKYTQGKTAKGTAERVLEAARALGYRGRVRTRPEPGAPAVGLFIADKESFFTTYYGPRLLSGMWRAADEFDAHLFLFSDHIGEEPVTFDYLRKEMESRGVSNLVVNVNNNLSEQLLETLEELAVCGTRIVALWRRQRGWDAPCVMPDDEGAAKLMVSHLMELGHRRLALVSSGPDPRTRSIVERFVDFVQESGAELVGDGALFTNDRVAENADDDNAGLLLNAVSPPTAVAALFDGRALGTTKALRSRGIRVPEDMSVIGYGNMPANRPTPVALTMVESPIERIGETAARLLLEPGSSYEVHRGAPAVRLPVTLRVRSTTGPARHGAFPAVAGGRLPR